jgi:hypothetical protein
MRFLFVAILVVGGAGAFAQTNPPSPPPSAPTQAGVGTLGEEQREHPQYFEEPTTYKPCPASVVFLGNRSPSCLGLPDYSYRTRSETLFPGAAVTVNRRPTHWRHGRGYLY